jgi:hypothetical protein
MVVDVATEIVINRPVAVVSEFAASPDNAPRWYVNIKAVEWKTPQPLVVGSRVGFVAQFLGRRLVYTYEVATFVPGEYLVMRTTEGPFPMETQYIWTPISDESTRMRLRNLGTPSGFSRLVAPFMAHAMHRANEKDLSRLKGILEQQPDQSRA